MEASTLTKKQTLAYGPRYYTERGDKYRITAMVRYDDECGNGHNTFAIAAEIDRYERGRWLAAAGGCLHDEVSKHFPNLAPLIRWHLVSSDAPMHYIDNTCYHAGDRDHNGLQKGELKQLRNGKTGKLSWKTECAVDLKQYVDADDCPTETAVTSYVPWCRVGEGKERDFDAARSCACDPTLTDEQLSLDRPELEALLKSRLAGILAEFRAAVESLGFVY